jgi:hypothetical protein
VLCSSRRPTAPVRRLPNRGERVVEFGVGSSTRGVAERQGFHSGERQACCRTPGTALERVLCSSLRSTEPVCPVPHFGKGATCAVKHHLGPSTRGVAARQGFLPRQGCFRAPGRLPSARDGAERQGCCERQECYRAPGVAFERGLRSIRQSMTPIRPSPMRGRRVAKRGGTDHQ